MITETISTEVDSETAKAFRAADEDKHRRWSLAGWPGLNDDNDVRCATASESSEKQCR